MHLVDLMDKKWGHMYGYYPFEMNCLAEGVWVNHDFGSLMFGHAVREQVIFILQTLMTFASVLSHLVAW